MNLFSIGNSPAFEILLVCESFVQLNYFLHFNKAFVD